MKMHHDEDPRETIMREMAPHLAQVLIGGCDVLVAMYVRPERMASGVFIPKGTREEDKYQGKAALVLQLGAHAFSAERKADTWFGDRRVMVGDWIVLNVNDTFPILVGDTTCRLVEDRYIRAIVQSPDLVM